jgi:hypothetical protein
MLQADNIAYSMSAVQGFDDIVEKVDEVDKDTCHTVVLLNCGASEDLFGMTQRLITTLIISLHISKAGASVENTQQRIKFHSSEIVSEPPRLC